MSTDPVHKAFVKVLDRLPVSIRELARRAGVSHVLLTKARDGEARLTADVTRKVVEALREISHESSELADMLEEAARARGDASDGDD